MSEQIDWSKAPAGATHYNRQCGDWYKVQDGDASVWSDCRRAWVTSELWGSRKGFCIERQPSWSGEDLPPVGVVCEYNPMPVGKPKKWHKVEVVYASEWVIVMRCIEAPSGHEGGNGVEIAMAVDSCSLEDIRPIRTPEQIAASEREAAVLDIYQTICISRAQAEAIYDAGYRKP